MQTHATLRLVTVLFEDGEFHSFLDDVCLRRTAPKRINKLRTNEYLYNADLFHDSTYSKTPLRLVDHRYDPYPIVSAPLDVVLTRTSFRFG